MIPVSVSASSLKNAEQCLSMYSATNIKHGASLGNDAAKLGTTLHYALETYTEPSMMTGKVWDLDFLIACFQAGFFKYFGPNTKSPWYKDGVDILTGWHYRPTQKSEIHDSKIISREAKSFFTVPYLQRGENDQPDTPAGMKVNYIIDRLDETGPGSYRVVDYKSQRNPYSPEEMMGDIQVRLYALAIQIMHPDATSISVQFDFLRYDRVTVHFSKEDNAHTWRWLKQAVQRIVDTPEDGAPETLGYGCRYCIRKLSCKTLQSNVAVGGIFSFSLEELADRFGEMSSQISGMSSSADEVEMQLLKAALESGEHEWYTPNNKVKVYIRKTRRVNVDVLTGIVGDAIIGEFKGSIKLSDVETIRADPRLTPTQRSLLETAVDITFGEPSIKITKRGINK